MVTRWQRQSVLKNHVVQSTIVLSLSRHSSGYLNPIISYKTPVHVIHTIYNVAACRNWKEAQQARALQQHRIFLRA